MIVEVLSNVVLRVLHDVQSCGRAAGAVDEGLPLEAGGAGVVAG